MQELFTTPSVIFHRISEKFKGETISESQITEWCFDAEVNYIAEADDSRIYKDVPLDINPITKIAILPCNVIRILDVYDSNEAPTSYTSLPPSRIKINDATTAKISYVGLNVDDNGEPYFRSSHVPALETYCTVKILEGKALMLKYPYQIYKDMEQKFSNQIVAIKQSWTNRDHQTSNRMDAIYYNMLPVAAQRRLYHKQYE